MAFTRPRLPDATVVSAGSRISSRSPWRSSSPRTRTSISLRPTCPWTSSRRRSRALARRWCCSTSARCARPHRCSRSTRAHPDTRIVVLANRPTAADCNQMLSFGATACLSKETEARDVISAIHLAARGMHVLPARPPPTAATAARHRGRRPAHRRARARCSSCFRTGAPTPRSPTALDRRRDRAHARAQDLPQARHRLAARAGAAGAAGGRGRGRPERRPVAG